MATFVANDSSIRDGNLALGDAVPTIFVAVTIGPLVRSHTSPLDTVS